MRPPILEDHKDVAMCHSTDLVNHGRIWIKQFMHNFKLEQKDLPTQVEFSKDKDLLQYEIHHDRGEWIDQGVGIIAFIKHYFGIKDGEELI